MQAILLAAGMGKRLGKYTKDRTKCMVEINGKRIIDYAIESILNAGINKLIIVTGYKGDILKNYLQKRKDYFKKNLSIIFIENKIYYKTNNVYSLWLAKDYLLKEDTILLESDIVFDKELVTHLIKDKRKNLCVVSRFTTNMDGTVVLLKNNNVIESFIPKKLFDWNHIEKYYKTVNIYKFSKQFLKKYYIPFLESYIKVFGNNAYYEEVLTVLTNIKKFNLQAFIIENDRWYEIDDYQDLNIASIYFSNKEVKLKKLEKRYGGYWRFKGLIDFCYLVNPYFPTERLIKELNYSFEELVRNYPSGIDVQNLLAARLFNVDENFVVTGNGASEFIKIIMENINLIIENIKNNFNKLEKYTIGVILPTFNEYFERLIKIKNIEIKYYDSFSNNFLYSYKNLISFGSSIDALILINPDNPSGNLIKQSDLMLLLDYFKARDKLLIVDESFIDFVDKDKRFTLMDDNILQKYKNMIVIKSISKSYGVPGLRLGVLASADESIINFVKKELPIWNINSFAENFLQIIPKYLDDYVFSCDLIASERNRFYKELKNINFLKVFKSQSNYFTCKLDNNIDSETFITTFLKEYNILLKNLKNKKGFKNQNFIRVAIRTRKDNNYLIRCLKDYYKKL